jgi:uncharacterized membrane protein YraQ (UPF0718 family)
VELAFLPSLFAQSLASGDSIKDNINNYLLTFMSIVLEALPFIVFGCILSGALEELLPQKFLQRLLPKNRLLAIMSSSAMGFVLPMCECGIVPVMRRLLAKGMPASCAITYMLSAPVINPIVMWSTMIAFSGHGTPYDAFGVNGLGMMLMRCGYAFVVAVTVGLVFEWLGKRDFPIVHSVTGRTRLVETEESSRLLEEEGLAPPSEDEPAAVHSIGGLGALPVLQPDSHEHHHHAPGEACDHDHHHDHADHHHHEHDHHDHEHDHAHHHAPRTLLDRLIGIADIALSDFLDILAFLVMGAAIAAVVRTFVRQDILETVNNYPAFSILAMMLFAIVISLCSEADAFVAANLKTLTVGSKLAFLVLGPMLDLKLLIMYRWVFTPKAVRVIVAVLIGTIFTLTLATDLLIMAFAGSASPR